MFCTNISMLLLQSGRGVCRVTSCFDAIKAFLAEKGHTYPELEDEKWPVKRMFLADITGHLNRLNLRLLGAGQVLDMFETWTAFVAKLTVLSNDISKSTFLRHLFSSQSNISTNEITMYMCKMQFTTRFVDFKRYGPMFSFLVKPNSMMGMI